jgi:hypothetical protein
MLAAIKRVKTVAELLVESGKLGRPGTVVLFKQPKCFPDHFTRGVVAAGFDFGAYEFLELGRKGDIHGVNSYFVTLALIAEIVNLRY